MEAIKNWLQNWSDACEYARECAPDFVSFPIPHGEPFTAIGTIALIFYGVWAINEHRLAARRTLCRQPARTANLHAHVLATAGH